MAIVLNSSSEIKYYYIYKTTNLINGKIYVGQHSTNNLNDGYIGHNIKSKGCFGDKNSNSLFVKAVRKYGYKNFKREIIEFCENREQLNELEIFWIKELDARNTKIGYNIAEGGKIKGLKGVPKSEEHKRKIGLANKGRIPSIECIQKAIKINTGKIRSIETEKKRLESRKGYKHTKETIEKIIKGRRGSHHSEKSKQKQSKAKDSVKKPVLQFDLQGNFIKEWESICSIQRELGFDKSCISAVALNYRNRKKAYGFIWKYKNVI